MINRLVLVTRNGMKLKNAQAALKKYGLEVEQADIDDVPELQSDDVIKVAEFSARYAGELLNKITVKIDVAFEIRALNGFPGPFVKYINQWLSPNKIIRLMEDEKDRHAQFVDCISLYEPGRGCVNFVSITPGHISKYVKGENGWGVDRIFVPDGYADTLASLSDEQKKGVWDKTHWERLGIYLQGLA